MEPPIALAPMAGITDRPFRDLVRSFGVGLMVSEIATSAGSLVFTSDLIPGQYWVHLPICMGYDRYPEALIDEKQNLLTRLENQGARLFFTHDATMPCALVKKDERGRFFAEAAAL